MKLTLTALIRLTSYVALGLVVLSVGVGRMVPPDLRMRRLARPPAVFVNSYACGLSPGGARFLEPETAQLVGIPLPERDALEQVSCAPWRDERGETQMAGRWQIRIGGA